MENTPFKNFRLSVGCELIPRLIRKIMYLCIHGENFNSHFREWLITLNGWNDMIILGDSQNLEIHGQMLTSVEFFANKDLAIGKCIETSKRYLSLVTTPPSVVEKSPGSRKKAPPRKIEFLLENKNPKKCKYGKSCICYHLLQKGMGEREIKKLLGKKYCYFSHDFEDDFVPEETRSYKKCSAQFETDDEMKKHSLECSYWHPCEKWILSDFPCQFESIRGDCTNIDCLCLHSSQKEEDESVTPRLSFSLVSSDFPDLRK